MALIQVVLDWFLMVLTLVGETFYLWKIVKEERTVLMDMMKYLILNDVLLNPIILFHDIPSYFMQQSLSDRVYGIKELGIFAQCLPFFYALLMLPIFALLNLIAIIAVHSFVTYKKRHISQTAIVSCYFLSLLMSIPLMTEYCGFNYNSETHYWYYDYEKPYTGIYQKFNGALQLVAFGLVGICMTIVLLYMAKRATLLSQITPAVRSSPTIEVIPNPSTKVASQTSKVSKEVQKPRATTHRSRSILDQAFAFLVLCLCFMAGTICFNFVYCSDGTICLIITVVSSYVNRAKWLIYCFLMRRRATISRLFRH